MCHAQYGMRVIRRWKLEGYTAPPFHNLYKCFPGCRGGIAAYSVGYLALIPDQVFRQFPWDVIFSALKVCLDTRLQVITDCK